MKRTRKFVSSLVFAFLFMLSLSGGNAGSLGINSIDHARELKLRGDGNYDVVCVDGEAEVRTPREVQAGEVCTHMSQINGPWTLIEGGIRDGMRFCDLEAERLNSRNRIIKLSLAFVAPCAEMSGVTEDCNGLMCNIRMGEVFFTADFSDRDRLRLTRLSDGLQAVFQGDSGGIGDEPPPPPSSSRIIELGGIANILQASNDHGTTWLSVCDDGFDREDARVACREMGFSDVDRFSSAVYVSGEEDFGLDDLECAGTEGSLLDCPHNGWMAENCGAGEHVQLYCVP